MQILSIDEFPVRGEMFADNVLYAGGANKPGFSHVKMLSVIL